MTENNQPENAWVVRAGDDNELIGTFEEKGVVAIGWAAMGDLTDLKTRNDFKARYQEKLPTHSLHRMQANAGQIYRFAREIAIGDYVLTFDKATRELLIGNIASELKVRPDIVDPSYPYVRRVKWLKRVSRDDFSPEARNSLGSIRTVFRVNAHLPEIHYLATGESALISEPDESSEETVSFYTEVKARADELIADTISQLDPYEFQDLVAGVLQAMGFRAPGGSRGRDRGVDIIAHPDALGFEKPRIKVQVKHRTGRAKGPEMRSFIATLGQDENGLFVSTGDFTADAKIEADKARVTVTLLNREQFIELMLEHYEDLDPAFQAQVPLRRVWVPASE